jgi:amidase
VQEFPAGGSAVQIVRLCAPLGGGVPRLGAAQELLFFALMIPERVVPEGGRESVTPRPADTATELAEAIASGRISSVSAVRGCLERIDATNPVLHAIVTIDANAAIAQARQADRARDRGQPLGVLHGVPITVKDSFDTEGLRTTSGYPPFAHRIPAADAAAVALLRRAGAIVLGKTNLPPLANGIQSNNPIFGRTRNPWDLSRTPGGSSGGGAAAVAAGLSPLDLGSDISGSLRIPAHFCGVFSLKPTAGLVPLAGHVASPRPLRVPAPWKGLLELASAGIITRSVRDLRLGLRALTDGQAARPGALASPRLAWTKNFGGAPLDRESRRALDRAAEHLSSSGLLLEERVPAKLDFERAWYVAGVCLGAINTLMQTPMTRWLRRLAATVIGPLQRHPILRGLYAGARLREAEVLAALQEREAIRAEVEAIFSSADAWLCPVFPTTAFTHRAPAAALEIDGQPTSMLLANLAHEVVFNLTGHPVVTLPIGLDDAGLPAGVQVIGRHGGDDHLLDVVARLDEVLEGYRVPPERGAPNG